MDRIGDKIIDPFCGTGGFMIYAFEVVSEKIHLNDFSDEEKSKWRIKLSNESLYGIDWKERTSQACKMNMMVHGDGNSGVFNHDMPILGPNGNTVIVRTGWIYDIGSSIPWLTTVYVR